MLSGCLGGGTGGSKDVYELTVEVKEGKGTVQPFVGKREYTSSTKVTLTAQPAENYEFERWEGEVSSPHTPETEVAVDGKKTVKAVFAASLGAEIPVETGEAVRFRNGVTVDLQNVALPAGTTVTVTDLAQEIELPTELELAGSAVDIDFGSAGQLDFSPGVTLRLPVAPGADHGHLGVFHQEGTEWYYQPTTVEGGSAVATVRSFSAFAVLKVGRSKPVESSITGFHVAPGGKMELLAEAGARIFYSTTSPDYPGDYQLYEEPLEMPGEYFEVYAVAAEPNKLPSEVTRFRYVDTDYTVVLVVDEAGRPMPDVSVRFYDGSDSVYTDEEGFAAQRIKASETIVTPYANGYVFEPLAGIGGPGVVLEYKGAPSDETIHRFELTFNPAEFYAPDRLNPFASAKIREAMNKLVDRDHLASLAGGATYPIWTFLTPDSYDYEFMENTLSELKELYAFAPGDAQKTIADEMHRLGAELRDGYWYYANEPVEIIFLIRSDDERKSFGDYIAQQLESIGFVVEKHYVSGFEAAPIWQFGDPAEGLWHLYTGGWVNYKWTGLQASNLYTMYTPGGQIGNLSQYYDPDLELLEVAIRLHEGIFESLEERKTVFARGLKLALEDSVRIWLTAK